MADNHDLVDTQEMYLKAITELHEVGMPALRARLAERFEQSSPTVSETVNRMSKAGLLTLGDDRVLRFTEEGEQQALSVMRKHRIIERFLHEVVKLDWAAIHDEACRWEHVASNEAVDLMEEQLSDPTEDPFGNRIPQLAPDQRLHAVAQPEDICIIEVVNGKAQIDEPLILSRIGEVAQVDNELLQEMQQVGVSVGTEVTLERIPDGYLIQPVGEEHDDVFVPEMFAHGVFVMPKSKWETRNDQALVFES